MMEVGLHSECGIASKGTSNVRKESTCMSVFLLLCIAVCMRNVCMFLSAHVPNVCISSFLLCICLLCVFVSNCEYRV